MPLDPLQNRPPLFTFGNLNHSLKDFSAKIKELLERKLWLKVLVALGLGMALGVGLGPDLHWVEPAVGKGVTDWLALPGQLFLQMVKMMVIPLVFSSIILGIISSGDVEFLKKIGPRLLAYFVLTTTLAIGIGFAVAYTIKPGNYVELKQAPIAEVKEAGAAVPEKIALGGEGATVPERIVNILPGNPLESMVSGDMLGVVIFTIILGIAALTLPPALLHPLAQLLETIQQLSMRIVKWAMELVPLAVFGLMTQITSQLGLSALAGLGMYILTVLLGLLLLLGVYQLVVLFFTVEGNKHFTKAVREVQILAFSTSSSAAVMPLSIKTAEDKLKVRPAIAQFLIPVGATINMDGTAMYQVVATVFLAQVFGAELSLASMLLVVVITVGASIGAPSAPGVGIVILATILESVGIPASGVALILGVDRILDMSRTAVNVTGDLTACAFFDRQMATLFDLPVQKEEYSAEL